MAVASRAARDYNDSLPNEDFYIPESSPIAAGTGKSIQTDSIPQFPGKQRMPESANEGFSFSIPSLTDIETRTN